MTIRVSSNFNMYGHRIISLYNGGDNQAFIKTVCVRHFLSKIFGFDNPNFNKQTHLQDFQGGMHVGHNTLIGYKSQDFNVKLERIKGNSNDKFKEVFDKCIALLNTTFIDKETLYSAMTSCDINIGVLVMNERKHPKLHIYRSDLTENPWLLIVDEKQEANMKNMGVVTSNTNLLATSEEILESDFTFSKYKFADMMNKYKVEVVYGDPSGLDLNYLDMYKPKDMPVKEVTKFDAFKHVVGQKVRRVGKKEKTSGEEKTLSRSLRRD